MKFETKEYPDDNEVVINELTINYSQTNEINKDFDNLKLSICSQGDGFYFVMETSRWAFENIADLDQILADFKSKANIK
jgi:hypothetical protein